MKAINLYKQLEQDFVRPEITEDWYDADMSVNTEFICDNFKQRSIGLLCDFAEEIGKVYTAVFPSDEVLAKILDSGAENAMLFLHHPLIWDLSKDPAIAFYQINPALLRRLKERHISLFNFHLPLDNFSEYSTTKTLADALGIEVVKPYNLYCGAVCGIIGKTDCKTVEELANKYTRAVGHATRLYCYGDAEIKNGLVSLCAGGGNDNAVVSELIAEGVNVHITGLSTENKYSAESHRLEREHGVNLLGGTHYSSEKFACIAMCGYFEKLGLASEFIPGVPCFEDL
jgi:putative NIF3 family GTP cyclohydrolase 1 type 2